ncbi:MAG TPA: hypothetical protein PKA27_06110 [Fimbriimonadaceae bacterium]|nr:hypothetical protein [Fimbriimonadaceae bacterium]
MDAKSLMVVVCCGLHTVADAQSYSVRDLGLEADIRSTQALNNQGDVLVGIGSAGWSRAAVLQRSGQVRTLEGVSGMRSVARGINDHGSVVGWLEDGGYGNGALWNSEGLLTIIEPQSEFLTVRPERISNSGLISGLTSAANGTAVFLVSDGSMRTLGGPGGSLQVHYPIFVTSLSESGTIVGEERGVENPAVRSTWIWTENSGFEVHSGGPYVSWNGYKYVNSVRAYAGFSKPNDAVWVEFNSVRQQTGLFGDLLGFNDLGQVLVKETTGAFRVWAGGQDFLLSDNDAGLVVTWCYDLNDLGQVLVAGTRNGRETYAVLTPVPEPSTLTGLGSLVCLTIARNVRRKRGRTMIEDVT